MKPLGRTLVLVWLGVVGALTGCGGSQAPVGSAEEQANSKVAAMQRLADALAKDPNGIDARAALEDYRVTSFDVAKNRSQAEEILDIYRKRIQGKYRGEVAQEIQIDMKALEGELKRGK
jgi:hypothetical protein